jgi:hypothetical protein
MAITRLGIARPTANDPATLYTFTEHYFVSVIATNVAPTSTPVPRAAVYVVPSGAVTETSYAYICKNLSINPGDTLKVQPTTSNVAFAAYGILQDDAVGNGDLPQTFTNKIIRGVNNTIYLDKGNSAQRNPASEIGYVRFNTEYDTLEVRTAAGWKRVTVTE